MPRTKIILYRDEDGSVPLVKWLRGQPLRVQNKCTAMIELLAEKGNALRRPHADYLREGIYELRPTVGRVHYRILYCFVGRCIVLLIHGFVKEDRIPQIEIVRALEYKKRFSADPLKHSFELGELP